MRAAIAGCGGLAKECSRIWLISALYTVQLATSTAPWHDVRRVPLQRETDAACYKGAQGAFRCKKFGQTRAFYWLKSQRRR